MLELHAPLYVDWNVYAVAQYLQLHLQRLQVETHPDGLVIFINTYKYNPICKATMEHTACCFIGFN